MINNMVKEYKNIDQPNKNNDEEIARRYVRYMAGGR